MLPLAATLAAPPPQRLTDGDAFFQGVNELDHPAQLQPGELAGARNNRCTEGDCAPRLGWAKLAWTNNVAAGATTAQPFATIYGAGEYKDTADRRWLIIAANGRVYRTIQNSGAVEVPLPPGVTIDYEATFVQTEQGLLLLRGVNDEAPLLLTDLDVGFAPVAIEANTGVEVGTGVSATTGAAKPIYADGTLPLPNISTAEWIGNRLWFPFTDDTYGKDLLGASDYLNATRFAFRDAGRVNQGSADALLRYFKFNEDFGVAFKEKSIYIVGGTTGNLAALTLQELTRNYGIAGPKCVATVGKDVWFLAPQRGIMSVSLTEENKFKALDIPVSRELHRTMKRMDWRNAHKARFAVWDNKFFAALPLDESKAYGAELLRGTLNYASSTYSQPVIGGKVYRWTKGANDVSLVNGATTLTETAEFTAAAVTVTLNGVSASATITASLQRVYEDTCNAVAVYDLLKSKWAGVDEGTAILPQEFVETDYAGSRRLFCLGTDGWLNLLEELFHDEVGYESLGANIISGGQFWSGSGIFDVAVTPGQLYAYQLNEAGYGVLPDQLLSADAGWFITTGAVLNLQGGTPSSGVTTIIKPVSFTLAAAHIDHEALSRGYLCQDNGRKRFTGARTQLNTWYPSFTLHGVTDGQAEETQFGPASGSGTVTRSRTRYARPFDRADWDETNYNDDHATAYREDYAVVLTDDTVASGALVVGTRYLVQSSDVTTACSITHNAVVYTNGQTFVAAAATFSVTSGTPVVYGPGAYLLLGANGVDPDKHQDATENWRVPPGVTGRYAQVRFNNTQGRARLRSIEVEAVPMDKRKGKHF